MIPDETLYRRYLGGDDEGLNALMERHGDRLTLYLDGCLHDTHEAEDVMIEAFARLIASRPDIRDGGFRAYLYKTARRLALRLLARRRARQTFSLDELTEEPEGRELVEQTVQAAESGRILRACMAELRPDYREALFLVYFEGLSHAEAAAVMGKWEKQVADLVYRGRNALRKRLEQEGISHAHE
ncbi:RNA polymerase sigma factor [uncultured Oscillibacter sp.]|uniref:RNA polymerase sigma factor n=1 Tax=uncultured Oscillibacter sp. TaxID=876091 RepID=UPI0025DA7B2B|nr:RNA polymerase sigma factor [uncultured Oscillibacter sp.]